MPTLDRPAGITWADLLEDLVAQHGTLAQVAWKLVERADQAKTELDVASVERALRRLRTRGQRDGGAWGQRLVRVFGMPKSIEDRVRWLGLYHSPFNDLSVALCLDQLRLWDRPPMSNARARLWIELGFATCATRTRRLDDARMHARRASDALASLGPDYDVARLELALLDAFLASHPTPATTAEIVAPVERAVDELARLLLDTVRREREIAIAAALARADALLSSPAIDDADRACFAARLADQRAYQLNRAGEHSAALALYESLPKTDVHPFASYRRDAGLAYGAFRTGRAADALALVQRAIEHAGDGGYTRLRVMGLLMLARITDDATQRSSALDRARAIASRLGDDELLARTAKLAG